MDLRALSGFGGCPGAGGGGSARSVGGGGQGPGGDGLEGPAEGPHVGEAIVGLLGHGPQDDGIDGRYLYGKLGYRHAFFDVGATAFAVDTYVGDSIDTPGAESLSFGAFVVQDFDDYQTQLYLGVRSYAYDDDAADYRRLVAAMTGVRVKF